MWQNFCFEIIATKSVAFYFFYYNCHKNVIMEKRENIRAVLGVTQEDLAMLLKVTRSQLSMYELGKRDLPLEAKQQLTAMLLYVQENTSKLALNKEFEKAQKVQKKKVIDDLVIINKHRQVLLEKKMTTLDKKYQANSAAIKVVAFLKNQVSNKNKESAALLKYMETKAVNEITTKEVSLKIKYEIKKELLQAEEKLLVQFLQKLR